MHENREISSPPWSNHQGPISCHADMHVLETSDCVLVPVNQPNIFAHIYVSPGAASPVPQLRRYTYLARGWISAEARLGESEREGSLQTLKLAWT